VKNGNALLMIEGEDRWHCGW